MNKEININNYEEFVLDYLEQNLDAATHKKFEQFLEQNPEIREEISDLLSYTVEPGNTDSIMKLDLKKSEISDISYFEYLCIADVEKTITIGEKKELEQIFAQNPELLLEYEQFNKTIIKKYEKITYPNKAKLKHLKIVNIRTIGVTISALAAMLIIFFGIKSFTFNENNQANICSNSIDIDFFRNIISTIEDSTIIEETSHNYSYNQVIAEQEIVDTNTLNNHVDYYDSNIVVADFELPTNNTVLLTNLENPNIELPNNTQANNMIFYNPNKTGRADKLVEPQKIVDFFVKQYNTFTENEATVIIEIDKNNKCYGLEINDKNYEICFDDKLSLNNF